MDANNSNNNMQRAKSLWTPEFEDEVDAMFLQRVIAEVTQSCALPFSLPQDQVVRQVINAAMWFWENVDQAVEERDYVIRNKDICKGNHINKIIQLPPQIIGVFGCFKLQEDLRYSSMGDFSLERMLMSSYSMFGGAGIIGGGMGLTSGTGYSLPDVMMSLYEVDTFDQFLNPPLSYNYNSFSSKLVLLGDLGHSDLVIETYLRCKIQDLYNSYYFFRLVVCFCKRSLATIYGSFQFKYPGGVEINYDGFKSDADDEIEKIHEWAKENQSADYFMMPKNF